MYIKINIEYLEEEFNAFDDNQPEDDLVDKDLNQNSKSDSSEKISKIDKEETSIEKNSIKETSEEEVQSEKTSLEEISKVDKEETPVEKISPEEIVEGKDAQVEDSEKETPSGVTVERTIIEEISDKGESETKLGFNFKNLIGKKIGMTQLFSDKGNINPATVIEAGPCSVIQIKNMRKDGYDAVQIGFSDLKESKINKSIKGHFEKSKSSPKRILKEFRIHNTNNLPKIGDVIDLHQFNAGEFITVTGFSIGKGFAGHMKRHGFSGGTASHGKNSVMRKAGSVGAGTDPGRIFPGMKMAGRMGNSKVTIKNLRVLNIDYENNLIFIKGSIPGSKNNYLFLTKN